MSVQNIPTARSFRDSFIASYLKVRAAFANQWNEPMPYRQWNELMLSRPTETARLPKEINASVLAEVAKRLSLCYPSNYPNRQPMTFDAVFSEHSERQDWFPIRVAIEHENNCIDFWSEICKLLSVRCPLKVGITYITGSRDHRSVLAKIEEAIRSNFALVAEIVGESPAAEYLFLVWGGLPDKPKEVWYALDFRASDGPARKTFQPVEPPPEQQKGAA